jgi:branched-chain amino acid transport system permease protein
MQSLAQNKEVAAMIGVNTPLIISVTFIIGGTILAIGGFLIGSYYNIVRFDMGSMYGLMGYSAAVVGGLGNIYGAIVGGMLLAFAETFMTAYIPGGTAYAKVFSFLIVILFMIFKSEGIIGQKTIEKV